MSNRPESSHTLSNLPMAIRLKIESVCGRFEEELRSNSDPQIEEYLNENSELPRGHLLRELLVQEIQYLSQSGFEPEIPSCLKRFPDDQKMVEHAFSIAAPLFSGSGQDSIPAESEVPKELRYFGEYELLKEINRGGMGIVYLAKQKRLGRIVAIKTIISGLLASKYDIKRFETEARATALLDHPGIVPIYQIGEHEGKHFYSMAYVDGPSLADVIKRGPIAPYRAVEIIRKAAEAVQHAHDHQIIHRDIKPGNILLATNDTPRITDFGLAKIVQDTKGSSTDQGIVLGTAGFMSPEQASGMGKVTFSTDIYALGSTLYNLLTGRPPFAAADIVEVLRQVKEIEPASPRLLNPAIPEELEAIVMKCLSKDPRKRYRTAAEFAGALEKCFDDTVAPTQVSKLKPQQDQALSLVFDGNDDIADIDDFYETPLQTSRPVPARRSSRKKQSYHVKKKAKPKSGLATTTAILLILQWISMMIMMGFLITGMVESFRDSDVLDGMNIMAGITTIFSIPGVICFMMWLRDMWGHVDEREDRPTPLEAIMYLFIPFYNFYWIFRVIPGLSLALQEDFDFHHPKKELRSSGYGLGVFAAAGNLVPILNFIAPLLLAIWVLKANSAKNNLLCAEQGLPIEKTASPPSHKLRNMYAWGIVVCSTLVAITVLINYTYSSAIEHNDLELERVEQEWNKEYKILEAEFQVEKEAALERLKKSHSGIRIRNEKEEKLLEDVQYKDALNKFQSIYDKFGGKSDNRRRKEAEKHEIPTDQGYKESYKYRELRDNRNSFPESLIVSICISGFLLFVNYILYLLWLYEAWKNINPQENRPTPGSIIWRLFIPLYSLYWIFRAIPGLSRALRDENLDSSQNRNRYYYTFSTVLCGISIGYMLLRPLFVQLRYNYGDGNWQIYEIDNVISVIIMGAGLVLSPILSQISPLFSIWMFLENREINKLTALKEAPVASGSIVSSSDQNKCRACGFRLTSSEKVQGICSSCLSRENS